jgi:hypothetical protein
MQKLFWRNNIEAGHNPSLGLYTTIRSSFYMLNVRAFPFEGMYPGTFYIRAIGRELGEVYTTAKLHKMQGEHLCGS